MIGVSRGEEREGERGRRQRPVARGARPWPRGHGSTAADGRSGAPHGRGGGRRGGRGALVARATVTGHVWLLRANLWKGSTVSNRGSRGAGRGGVATPRGWGGPAVMSS